MKDNSSIPDLSIIILCYKAGEDIRAFVQTIQDRFIDHGITFELILVANYWPNSDDPTPEIVKDIAQASSNCVPVTLVKEGMMGWDMRTGLEVASGHVLAVIDGDNQFPPESLLTVYPS